LSLYEPPNLSAGIDDALIDVAGSVPTFIPLFLLFVWGIVFFSGVIQQKRRTGTSDIPLWATIAGLSTIMISLPLTLTLGMIQLETLVIVTIITIFSGFWLFFDKNRNEV